MTQLKEHIIFKGAIIILVITLLVPSLVKFTHILEDHDHKVCIDPQNEHFHEYNLECEFYKFKINPQITAELSNQDLIEVQNISSVIISQYQFISDYQRLAFSLRGPPSLV